MDAVPLISDVASNSSFSDLETTPGPTTLLSPISSPEMEPCLLGPRPYGVRGSPFKGDKRRKRPVLANLCSAREETDNPFCSRKKRTSNICTEYLEEQDSGSLSDDLEAPPSLVLGQCAVPLNGILKSLSDSPKEASKAHRVKHLTFSDNLHIA
eukprot:TRINITY_DN6536_c1_g2_i1.p1 TRINITY_DN6536_c1_g2~~TRINITY_DN6536_c1_g2_i1.p1  ORF type:complete len:154 (+),score=17.06 TRINITY_DN6536_c1_g2_i1:110-571(+)